MTIFEIISIILAVVILISVILYLIIGEICCRLILRRKSVAESVINYQMDNTLNLYKIDYDWWKNFNFEKREIISFDGLKLYPVFYKSNNSRKVAIIIHGYFAHYTEMNQYAKMFINLGYNIVLTQNRAHGDSEGKYVGMGWLDRLDILTLLDEVNNYFGSDCEIVVFGLSMGASTVCLLSGEKLPTNVTHLIADCGYSSVYEEFTTLSKRFTKISIKPLMFIFNSYCLMRCGYELKEADCLKQLARCKLPILFIHGDADTFVDYSMQDKLYNATPKHLRQKLTFSRCGHAESLPSNIEEYYKEVEIFLNKK